MALLAGLVIAALPDRAALTFAVVPSANISASFTTSTIPDRIVEAGCRVRMAVVAYSAQP